MLSHYSPKMHIPSDFVVTCCARPACLEMSMGAPPGVSSADETGGQRGDPGAQRSNRRAHTAPSPALGETPPPASAGWKRAGRGSTVGWPASCPAACRAPPRRPVAAAAAGRATPRIGASAWGGAPAGVCRVRRVTWWARSCRPSSGGRARDERRWPVRRSGPQRGAAVWHGARSSASSRPWPAPVWAVPSASRVWSRCGGGVGGHGRRMAGRRPHIAAA